MEGKILIFCSGFLLCRLLCWLEKREIAMAEGKGN